MKKTLSIGLTIIMICISLPVMILNIFAENAMPADYTIEVHDYSWSNSSGELKLKQYYEQVVINSSDEKSVAVNALIQKDREEFLGDPQELIRLTEEESPRGYYSNYAEASVVTNQNNIFSIKINTCWDIGGTIEKFTYGLNFDANTGNVICLSDLFSLSEHETEEYFKKKTLEYVHSNPQISWFNDAFSNVTEIVKSYSLEDFKYYIENNNIMLCYNPGTIAWQRSAIIVPCSIKNMVVDPYIDILLNEDFSSVAGTYTYPSGETTILLSNGMDRIDNNLKVDAIKKNPDGSYYWLIREYYDGELGPGYGIYLYPVGVEVRREDGSMIETDTSRIRMWQGHEMPGDPREICYKGLEIPAINQNDKYSDILNGDFSSVAGTYTYPSGKQWTLLSSGMSKSDYKQMEIWGTTFKVENITKDIDGSYSWDILVYDNGECVDGAACILWPEEVEVTAYDGSTLKTDTSRIRMWKGNAEVSDTQYICYKEPETPQIKVLLNGKEIKFDQPPIMTEGNRVMVPMRKIFEELGYIVDWDNSTHTATATTSTNKIVVQINNNIIHYTNNGVLNKYTCDVVPQIVSGRTLVPVRAVAESAGCNVQWDGENKKVIITHIS